MPVEIKEIQITAVVEESSCNKKSNKTSSNGQGLNSDMPSSNQQIIQACVDHVLQILEARNER